MENNKNSSSLIEYPLSALVFSVPRSVFVCHDFFQKTKTKRLPTEYTTEYKIIPNTAHIYSYILYFFLSSKRHTYLINSSCIITETFIPKRYH